MRPKSILLFERLFIGNTLVSILPTFIDYSKLRADALNRGAAAAGPLIGIATILIINTLLWYFIARRGSRVAKWILVVVYAIGFLTKIPMSGRIQALGTFNSAMNALSSILSIAAIVMLFQQDARIWLAHGGGPSPTDPSILE